MFRNAAGVDSMLRNFQFRIYDQHDLQVKQAGVDPMFRDFSIFSCFFDQRFNAATGFHKQRFQVDRPAPFAPLAGPAICSEAASSAQGHYVQFSHPSGRLTRTVSVLKQSAWEKET